MCETITLADLANNVVKPPYKPPVAPYNIG